jgi:hypothetical protein
VRRRRWRRIIDDDAFVVGQIVRDHRRFMLLLVGDLLVMIAIALALCVVSGVTLTFDSAVGWARPARPARRVTARRIPKRSAVHARFALGRHFFHFFFFIIIIFFFFSHILSHHRMIERSIFDRAETGNTRTSRTFHAKVRAD